MIRATLDATVTAPSPKARGPAPCFAHRFRATLSGPVVPYRLGMRTLHPAFRITDLATSMAFYGAIGFEQVGRVDLGDGVTLTMLKFPADEVVTLELVHRPPDGPVVIGSGFSHLAVQVDDLGGVIEAVTKAGLSAGPVERPGGVDGPQTSWLCDPDGYRIELVQWPPGHAYGITAADFR